ncbi:MAG: hypothetical protein HY606_08860 [Planctomycetes bacterium]|nr:hypothetical protein [Planctomycetota bacterium]
MTSYERVKATLELKEPDRVPILEFFIDPRVARAACPDAADIPDFVEKMDMDGIGCGAFFKKVSEQGETYVDEWGVTYKSGMEMVSHPIKGPISSFEDLRAYSPPDPEDSGRLGKLPEMVCRFKGRRAIVFHHRAAFMWSAYLMGLDNLLMSFLSDPKLANAILDMVVEVNEVVIRRAIRAGADIVVLGDDYATNIGPLMSPELFCKFLLPRLRRVVNAIKEEGAYCIKHSDGNIYALLDMIIDTGIDGLNPIEPVAGMDIGVVKAKYGKRVCLIGNIDCGYLLSHGSVEDVERAVKECIAKASIGGGHIISSSNSIHSSVKPENFIAMIHATEKYGKYPISLLINEKK